MFRDLYLSLTPSEQRAIRWSAAATAAVLWLSTAWVDPWFLLAVPLIAAGYVAWVKHNRRDGGQPVDDDWDF